MQGGFVYRTQKNVSRGKLCVEEDKFRVFRWEDLESYGRDPGEGVRGGHLDPLNPPFVSPLVFHSTLPLPLLSSGSVWVDGPRTETDDYLSPMITGLKGKGVGSWATVS